MLMLCCEVFREAMSARSFNVKWMLVAFIKRKICVNVYFSQQTRLHLHTTVRVMYTK